MAKTLARKVTIFIDDKPVNSTLRQLQTEIKKLRKEQEKLPIGTDEYIKKSQELSRLQTILKEQKDAVRGLETSWQNARDSAATYSNILMGVQSAGQMVSKGYQWMEGFVEQAAQMDDAMAQVAKRTGMSAQEVERLNETFKAMDTRTTREELASHPTRMRIVERHFGIVGNGVSKVGALVVSVRKVGAAQIGPRKVGTMQVGLREVGTREIGAGEVGTIEIGHTQILAAQVGTA